LKKFPAGIREGGEKNFPAVFKLPKIINLGINTPFYSVFPNHLITDSNKLGVTHVSIAAAIASNGNAKPIDIFTQSATDSINTSPSDLSELGVTSIIPICKTAAEDKIIAGSSNIPCGIIPDSTICVGEYPIIFTNAKTAPINPIFPI
jgi:hypothetical protein